MKYILVALAFWMFSLSSQVYPAVQEIEIITEKSTYNLGETITATLFYDGQIGVFSANDGWLIQRWVLGSWVSETISSDLTHCSNMTDCNDVDLNTIDYCNWTMCEMPCWYLVNKPPKLVWNQFIKVDERKYACKANQDLHSNVIEQLDSKMCVVFKQAPAGRYKVVFKFARNIDHEICASDTVSTQYVEKEIIIK